MIPAEGDNPSAADDNSINVTIRAFGYPATLLCTWQHWLLLLRPKQVTLGSLVLAARSNATAFGALPAEAHAELAEVTYRIEQSLSAALTYDRINYLMLMMVDPHVHFHVLPRYKGHRTLAGLDRADSAWPDPPMLDNAWALNEAERAALLSALRPYFA